MKLGITLPSFTSDPDVAVRVAAVAEEAGLDGVFVYDHVFRVGADGRHRPALDCVSLLAAAMRATERILVGTLVVRASLRPAATLTASLDTAARLAPGRLIAGLGAGDSESRSENERFGLPFGHTSDRVDRLRDAVRAARDRGYPVWVGGLSAAVRAVAAEEADGWNAWGTDLAAFREHATALQRRAERPFTCSWGGLVAIGADEPRAERGEHVLAGTPEAVAATLRAYAAAGAGWIILGPVRPDDPEQARRLGRDVAPRLRS